MAYNVGQKTTYTDTNTQIRNVEDLIEIISPRDVPLLKVVAGLNEAAGKPNRVNTLPFPCTLTKYEWIEDNLGATSDTLGEAIGTTNTTTCSATDGSKFRAGHVVQIDSELIWVSSVSSNTLTVVRAFGGTTGATHLISATMDIVGVAMLEGADAVSARETATASPYNYTQIFQDTIQVTGTEAAIKQYGSANNAYQYQLGKKFAEQAILLERAIFNGKRAVGTATAARAMGGLGTFITGNVTALASAALTEKDINDTLALIFADVGLSMLPQDIFVNQWLKRKISSFYAPYAKMDSKERAGGVVVDVVRTEFGDMNVHLNLWNPASQVTFLNLDNFAIGPLQGRGFFEEKLAKSGDYIKGQIVGEYTCMVKNDNSHGLLTGVSTSS